MAVRGTAGKLSGFVFTLKNYNLIKIVIATILELIATAINIVIPLILLEKFRSKEEQEDHVALVAGSAGALISAQILPKISKFIVDRVRTNLQKTLTDTMVDKAYQLELDTHLTTRTGDFAQALSKNYSSIDKILPSLFSEIFPITIETLSGAIVLSVRYGAVGGFELGIFALFLATAICGEKITEITRREGVRQSYQTYGVVIEAIQNYAIAKQFGNSEHEIIKSRRSLDQSEEKFNETFYKENRSAIILSIINGFGLAGSLAYVALTASRENIQLFDFALIGYYLMRFNANLMILPGSINTFNTALVDAEKLVGFLNRPSKVVDAPNARFLDMTSPPRIEFRNVTFSYQQKKVLQNVSFVIEAGKKVSIVGPTNSGKSTIIKLLFRFYQPDSGEILINGVNLNEYQMGSIRSYMAIVAQDSPVFNDTIAANIRYGDLNAVDDEVKKSAELAELINESNVEKLQARAGIGGGMLSGGEKQRTTIARALLREAFVFLLDEPTSALDSNTEKEVQSLLDSLTLRGTTLLVTHRLNTTYNSHQILYLENGRIAESGTFYELRAHRDGKFNGQFETFCREVGIDPNSVAPAPIRHDKSVALQAFWQQRQRRTAPIPNIQDHEVSNETTRLVSGTENRMVRGGYVQM